MKLKRFIASIFLLILIGGTVSFFAWATAGFKDKSFGPVKKAVDKIQKKESGNNKEVGVAPNVLLKGKDLSKNIDEVLSGQMKQVMFRGATEEGNVKKVQLEVVAEPINAQAEIKARLLFKGTRTTKNSKGEDISKYLTMNPIKTKGVGLFEIVKKQTFEEEAVLELKADGQTYEITIGCVADEFDLTHDFFKEGRVNVNADINKPLFDFNLDKGLKAIGKSIGTQKDKYSPKVTFDAELTFTYNQSHYLKMLKYLKDNGYGEIDKIFTFKRMISPVGGITHPYTNHEKIKHLLEKEGTFFQNSVVTAEIKEDFCDGEFLKKLFKIFYQRDITEQQYKEIVRHFYNTNGSLEIKKGKYKNSPIDNQPWWFTLNFGKILLHVGDKVGTIKSANVGMPFPDMNMDLVGIDNPVTNISGSAKHIDV